MAASTPAGPAGLADEAAAVRPFDDEFAALEASAEFADIVEQTAFVEFEGPIIARKRSLYTLLVENYQNSFGKKRYMNVSVAPD